MVVRSIARCTTGLLGGFLPVSTVLDNQVLQEINCPSRIIQSDAEGPGPETRPATWSTAKVPLPVLKGNDTAMSNQGDPSTNPPHLPVHVFTNIGDQNNVISIKRFATTRKARIWVDQLEKERPGLYCITDEVEMDQSV